MQAKFKIKVSDERATAVYEDIARGSEPELRFYAMVAASTAIAAFGLIKNSTAIVIGAMLVAPLMTPIFGIALALVRGDASLLGRSIRAEIMGVILTVALAACFGIAIPELEVTPEMLSRTSPNLLDLLVAVLTQSGDSSFDKLQDKFLKQTESLYKKKINKIIEESL